MTTPEHEAPAEQETVPLAKGDDRGSEPRLLPSRNRSPQRRRSEAPAEPQMPRAGIEGTHPR